MRLSEKLNFITELSDRLRFGSTLIGYQAICTGKLDEPGLTPEPSCEWKGETHDMLPRAKIGTTRALALSDAKQHRDAMPADYYSVSDIPDAVGIAHHKVDVCPIRRI